ncbi:hypothetical protein E4T38_09252 [Aureobasidium subglaciale]|nr:hypothetical protein E4T38_09252 [Aureobasidium subglaciale]KAI5214132.1 hypothetical protein E4T40_09203 [Aureobasidium subglaciale]KAI5216585.1 hypothetical protein E4T41_09204 [Aureobasidium subglaciale]KAI5254439.1 hypothetical protein E4T46_09159 [Aureobasidium subglaciale]
MSLSEKVEGLCRNPHSVSQALAEDPTLSPGEAAKRLYHPDNISISEGHVPSKRAPATDEELERAMQCGKFTTQPSELFLRVFHDSLMPLEHDPLMGCCSPSLVGSSGTCPLTIISGLPDICRHMSNLIARAEKEVLLATNYWMDSDASRLITDGLKELSRRAGERGERAVVKIMYDRGNVKQVQVMDNHQTVLEPEYTGKNIRLPSTKEAPNLDMQVLNYHRPMLGTFHSKFMVVDRRVGVVSSNNIQDNSNMEMMCHVEGPIVDSLYDTFLISWHNPLEPILPSRNTPAVQGGLPAFDQASFRGMFDANGELNVPERGNSRSLSEIAEAGKREVLPLHAPGDPHYDVDIAAEVTRMQSVMSPRDGETGPQVAARHLNRGRHLDLKTTIEGEYEVGEEMTPYIPHRVHKLVPMALVNRKPYGATNHNGVYMPQNEAWLSAVRNARRSVFIQTPDLNAAPLIPELLAAVRRGVEVTYYVCLGYNDAGELLPFQGGHNEGVANKLYTSLTADETAARNLLHIHYYTAKDQIGPIHDSFKQRSCHVKLMIVDEQLGIMGNGNQDTQSWYHSQEVNIMIDSAEIVMKWRQGIERNQNTGKLGRASNVDGIWRDAQGQQAKGAIGVDAGKMSWAKGIVGAVQRVRGAGGF